MFSSPLALEVAPAIIAHCSLDADLPGLAQPPSFCFLRFIHQQVQETALPLLSGELAETEVWPCLYLAGSL